MFLAVEIASLLSMVIFVVLWIRDPSANYEPFTVLSGVTLATLELIRRRSYQPRRSRAETTRASEGELDVNGFHESIDDTETPTLATSRGAFRSEPSTTLFGWRMAKAFPGASGFVILEGKEAVDRLCILFEPPLRAPDDTGRVREPFWWFRGGQSSGVYRFRRLSDVLCLLNDMELPIRRIAAWRDMDERREFVYLEASESEPTGLYPDREPQQDDRAVAEPYGILGDYLVTADELADGHALIDGKPISLKAAERRLRYTTPFNCIITAKSSPMNSKQFDRCSRPIFAALLKGEAEFEDLVDAGRDLPYHYMNGDNW